LENASWHDENRMYRAGRYKQEYKHSYKSARTFCSDSFVIEYLFMSPWTEGRPVVKLHQNTIVHLFVLWAYSLINARNMNHANWNRYFPYVNTGCSTYINLLDLSLCMDSNIRNKVTWFHTTPSQIRIKFCKWPTGRTILLFCNTFITVLHMFRKTSCSSSGGQFLLIQHLVS
jgi:hypothetical protein